MRKALLLAVMLFLIGFTILASGCEKTVKPAADTEKKEVSESPPAEIRIGYPGSFVSGPSSYAEENGWFDDEFAKGGTDVKLTPLAQAGPAINEGLASKSLDLAVYADTPGIIARSRGVKIKLIGSNRLSQNIQVIVPSDSNLSSVKDLRGKKVAFIKGTIMHYFIGKLLENNGLKLTDIQQVGLATLPELNAAIAAKQVDAVVSLQAYYAPLEKEGKVRRLYDSKNDPKSSTWRGRLIIVVREEFADKYPETLKRWLNVYVKAARWGIKNKDKAVAIDAKVSGQPAAVFASNEFSADTLIPTLSDIAIRDEENQRDFWISQGILPEQGRFNVDTWADKSYLKSLGLK